MKNCVHFLFLYATVLSSFSCTKKQTYEDIDGFLYQEHQVVMDQHQVFPNMPFINDFTTSLYGLLAERENLSAFTSYDFEYFDLNEIVIHSTGGNNSVFNIDSVVIYYFHSIYSNISFEVTKFKVNETFGNDSWFVISKNQLHKSDFKQEVSTKKVIGYSVRLIPNEGAELPKYYTMRMRYNYSFRGLK